MTDQNNKKLWAGRFEKDIDNLVLDYTQTVDIDQRLIKSDLWGSLAHVIMLCHKDIIPINKGRAILAVLLELLADCEKKRLVLDKNMEDVHLNVEHMIISKLGVNVGGCVHTARSRNDQVVTDTRLYLRNHLLTIQSELVKLIEDLLTMGKNSLEQIMVGYTHWQPAQPITLAYWLTSYASMFLRDLERLAAAIRHTNQSPLGACALAGTFFPIDRELTAKLLGFDKLLLHGLDATSTRDFVVESIGAMAMVMSNISKLAEEIVLWNTYEFNLVKVDDAFATGSSIMPQKKNPVVAELARARVGRVYGALTQILTVVKGVTSGYSCDLQEDKPFLWQALDDTLFTIRMMRKQINTLKFNTQRAYKLCWENFTTATELANHLVAENQMAFLESHRVVGELVTRLIRDNKNLSDLDSVITILNEMDIRLTVDKARYLFDPNEVVKRQTSPGGTSPQSVEHIIAELTTDLINCQSQIDQYQTNINNALENTLRVSSRISEGMDTQQALHSFIN